MHARGRTLALSAMAVASIAWSGAPAAAQGARKPNILVIFGDDIGQTNVSAYSMGLMGYRTSSTYYDWFMSDGAGAFRASQSVVGRFLATFKDYPPSQGPSSFSIDQLVEKMQRSFETR